MIAALVIFIVAGLIATAVSALASRVMGDTGLGRVVATGVPILVMTIATFMILDQLKIAHNIVVITYAALLGAIALGSALAFGLGGRAVAERMLEGAYQTHQENKEQWKRDLDQGLARARDEAQQKQRRVERRRRPSRRRASPSRCRAAMRSRTRPPPTSSASRRATGRQAPGAWHRGSAAQPPP